MLRNTLFTLALTLLFISPIYATPIDSASMDNADILAYKENGQLSVKYVARDEEAQQKEQLFIKCIAFSLQQLSKGVNKNEIITNYLDPVLNYYQSKYSNNNQNIYSADNPSEAFLYATKLDGEHKNSLVISNNLAESNYLKGFILIESGQFNEGEKLLIKAVKLAPFNAKYLLEYGFALQRAKKWDQALEIFKLVQEWAAISHPDRVQAFKSSAQRSIAYCLVEQGQLDEAEAIYRELLKNDPKDNKSQNELDYIQSLRTKTPQQ